MNTTMAPTLSSENQNSNSPYERTDIRLLSVIRLISTRPIAHTGTPGIQSWISAAPAMVSAPTTITQKYQYSQPLTKLARAPSASRT